jgi:hypothetical protein
MHAEKPRDCVLSNDTINASKLTRSCVLHAGGLVSERRRKPKSAPLSSFTNLHRQSGTNTGYTNVYRFFISNMNLLFIFVTTTTKVA